MNAQVSVVMGSISDWSTMKLTVEILDKLNVPYEKQVVSAHRMPTELMKFGQTARERGIKVIIAGAGGAAHLPGMLAANTIIPVIGVPVQNPCTWRNGFITLDRVKCRLAFRLPPWRLEQREPEMRP